MAAPKQLSNQVDDSTDPLIESLTEVKTTMALLHSTSSDLIKSMSEILNSMSEMKTTLQSMAQSQITVDHNLPAPPANDSNDEKKSRLFNIVKVQVEMPLFNGHDTNLWILRAERYFEVGNFTEEEKIQLAYLSVDGPALSWFNFWQRIEPFVDWNDLKSRLVVRFGGLDSNSAFERLIKLEQEGSVREYIAEFEELAVHLKYSSVDSVYESFFVEGLKKEVKGMVRMFQLKGLGRNIAQARCVEGYCNLSVEEDSE